MILFSDLFGGLGTGSPQSSGDLAVVPLFMTGLGTEPADTTVEWRETLIEEALELGSLVIEEIGGGTVPLISVSNNAEDPVLIIEGDHLVGAKQNRAVWMTILVPALSKLNLPVSCVEQGRWSFRSGRFSASRRRMSPRIRRVASLRMSRSLKTGTGYTVPQGEVWDEVACFSEKLAAESPTGAYEEAFEQREVDVNDLLPRFPLREGQNGVLVLSGEELVGIEAAGSPDVFARRHEMILAPYLLEAIADGARVDGASSRSGTVAPPDRPDFEATAQRWLVRLAGSGCETRPSLGLGHDVRIEAAGLVGGGLEHEGRLVYLTAYDTREN